MPSITFIFNEFETKFSCQNVDSMEYLCQKYSNFIHTPLNNLFFSYNGKQINFKLTFEQIAEGVDKASGNISIFVITKEHKEEDKNNKNELNETKAKTMYDELIIKYEYIKGMDTEENIIKKITQLNFNELEIKNFYDKVKQMYDDLEDEYAVSGYIDEKQMIKKIIQLNLDKKSILSFIEKSLGLDS